MKAGLFVERTRRPAPARGDVQWLVQLQHRCVESAEHQYRLRQRAPWRRHPVQESNGHPEAHGLFYNVEWFLQDNWKVKRNFTIDAGMRFYWIQPTQSAGDQVAQFVPSNFSASKAPQLYQPITSGRARRAVNPVTGEILPVVLRRTARARHRRLQQRHAGVSKHGARDAGREAGTAHWVRVGS